MATAIIGTGNIGGTLARHLVRGGEPVVLAAKDEANAAALAQELGELARAASVEEAIAEADAVVFAVWLDTIKELIAKDAGLLDGKVVVDPSNPIGFDENGRDDADAARRPVGGLGGRRAAPRRRALRKGIRHARRRRARKRRKPRASAGRALLRHRRRRGCDDDRAADPCCRLRPVEGGRRRRSRDGSRCPAATSTRPA